MAVKLVKPINHKKVVKITNQDFEVKMRELRVNSDIAVAVSGGPDSLALMYLSNSCLLYTSPSPRDRQKSRMPSSA